MVGDQGGEGTPRSIPNLEVKLSSDMASNGESRERQDVADLIFVIDGARGRVVMIIRLVSLQRFSKLRGETF